jgi:hypothetical protein
MSSRRIGWSLCGMAVVLDVVGVALSIAAGQASAPDLIFGPVLIALAVVGALVAARQPRNAIGWLFLGAAMMLAVSDLADGYALLALSDGSSMPIGVAAAWLSSWLWVPAFYGMPSLLLLLFPDGHLLNPRWKGALWLLVLGLVGVSVSGATEPGTLTDTSVTGVPNPLGSSGLLDDVSGWVGWMSAVVGMILATVSLLLRYRRSRGDERLQMRWFVSAAVLFLTVVLVSVALYATPYSSGGQALLVVGFSALPLTTGVAILRYHLYDIDVVLNRTLVYGSLTAALAVVYLASVLLLRLALTPITGQSDLAVAASTLAVAALFRPLRTRIQTVVDRRFYRRRYDAARTLQSFTGRLRQQVDLDSVSADLRSVVGDTMQPAHVSLWLRQAAVTIPERPRSRKVSP